MLSFKILLASSTLFVRASSSNASEPFNWSTTFGFSKPLGYEHLYNFSGPEDIPFFCADGQCYAMLRDDPWGNTTIDATRQQQQQQVFGSGGERERPLGFLLVANNRRLLDKWRTPYRCPFPRWQTVRFNDCKASWPLPRESDVVVVRSAPTASGYWGWSNGSSACVEKFRTKMNVSMIGGHASDFDSLYRLRSFEGDERRITMSSGTTIALHIRLAYPSAPIVLAGFSFHSEYPCHMHSHAECPNLGHNYTFEERLVKGMPNVHFLNSYHDLRSWWFRMKKAGSAPKFPSFRLCAEDAAGGSSARLKRKYIGKKTHNT